MLNALCHFTNDDERESVDTAIGKISAEMQEQGKRPYPIPRGGGCMMGVLGHVLAVFEVYRQCAAVAMNPDAILMAVGSGGTYAGWLVGTKLLKLPWRLMGYSVSRDPFEASQQVARLANQTIDWLGFDSSFTPAEAPIIGGFIGPGYGLPSPEGAEAIKQVAAGGGILLDPVYTGKAMAGYIHGSADGLFDECKNVIFLHTGGEPAFFAGQSEWLSLNARSI